MRYVPTHVEHLTDGLAMVRIVGPTSSPTTTLWTVARTRKPHTCATCRRPIDKGNEVYRPLSNVDYRSARICLRCMP